MKPRYQHKKTFIQSCTAYTAMVVNVMGMRTEDFIFTGITQGFFLLKFNNFFIIKDTGAGWLSFENNDCVAYSEITTGTSLEMGDWQALESAFPAPSRTMLRMAPFIQYDFTENGVYIPGNRIRIRQYVSISQYVPVTAVEFCHAFNFTLGFQGEPEDFEYKHVEQ